MSYRFYLEKAMGRFRESERFFLITNTILTIQYQTPLTLITMFIYITFLTVTNNYTTYSIQLYNVLTTQSTDYTIT